MRTALVSLSAIPLAIVVAARPLVSQGRPATSQGTRCAATDARGFQRSVGDTSRAAQQRQPSGQQGAITGGTPRSQSYPEFDVVLDIPNVCVGRIFLKVDSLTAKISLDARVANLLRVTAGADVHIGNVDLTIQGVQARALLLVDLDDVVHVVDQTLTFIDNHPEIINQLTGTLQNVGGAVGGLVGGITGLLLGRSTNALGQTVERYLDQQAGSIMERTTSTAGQVVSQVSTSLRTLPTVREVTNATGQLVRQVRDQSGAIIEYTVDRVTNALSNIRVVQSAPPRD
jgi:gas vesicle protein